MPQEDVIIRIRAIDEATQNITKISAALKELQQPFVDLNDGIKRTTIITQKFNDGMEKGAGKTRRFRGEWLSLMFAGMALDRVFGGLVRNQLTLFGVSEMLSQAWTVVLLPVMELIVPLLYKLLDAFMNLPPDMKMTIGVFVLLGAIFGKVLMSLGMLVLALEGIAVVFGTTFGGAIAIVGSLIAVFAGIGLIVAGVVNIVKGKLEGIGLVIMGIGAILLLFIGWWALIPIAVGAAVYFIIKKWDKVKGFFIKVFTVIKDFFKKWIIDKFKEWISSLWGWIKNLFNKIKSFITDKPKEWISSLWNWIKNIFNKIKNFIIRYNPFRGLFDIGKNIFGFGRRLFGFQGGGLVPTTGPYILHSGERVIPSGRASSVVVSPTYNVYVHDKLELERVLKANNDKLVQEIKRQIPI